MSKNYSVRIHHATSVHIAQVGNLRFLYADVNSTTQATAKRRQVYVDEVHLRLIVIVPILPPPYLEAYSRAKKISNGKYLSYSKICKFYSINIESDKNTCRPVSEDCGARIHTTQRLQVVSTLLSSAIFACLYAGVNLTYIFFLGNPGAFLYRKCTESVRARLAFSKLQSFGSDNYTWVVLTCRSRSVVPTVRSKIIPDVEPAHQPSRGV